MCTVGDAIMKVHSSEGWVRSPCMILVWAPGCSYTVEVYTRTLQYTVSDGRVRVSTEH